ncbi:hypothetical protein ACGTN9_17400 [Halobacillus sp. MO56]
MNVLFTSKIDGEIISFHPYSFQDIVEKTEELDTKWKKKNAEPVPLDFMIFNEEGDKLYNGTYVVGSKETTNIYDHICQKLLQTPIKDQQQETERDRFLQKLTSHTPASYQVDITKQLKQKRERSAGWKKLSKRGKTFLISVIGLLGVALASSITLAMIAASQAQALNTMKGELANAKTMKQAYQTALNGDIEEAVDRIKRKENLNASEQDALIHLFVTNKNYEEALKRVGEDNVSLLARQVMQIHGMEELKSFQNSYPSAVGEFEIAYHSGNYDEVIAVKDVPMSAERYKEKGLSYLKLDQVEEAKKMASEAKSDELNEKINHYEKLKDQLNTLQEEIEKEKQSKDKNQDKIDSLKKQENDIKNQIDNI